MYKNRIILIFFLKPLMVVCYHQVIKILHCMYLDFAEKTCK